MVLPRFSTGYWPLHNRFAALVEAHSWKPYPRRVRTTVAVLSALLTEHVGEQQEVEAGVLGLPRRGDVVHQRLAVGGLRADAPRTRVLPGHRVVDAETHASRGHGPALLSSWARTVRRGRGPVEG